MIFLCCYRMVVIPENCVLLIFWFSILEISLKWDRTKQRCRFLIIFVLNKAELEGKAVRASTRPLWSDPQLLFFAFDKANSSYVYLWAWSSLLLAVGKVVFHPVLLELEGLCICKYLLVWTVFASLSIARYFFFSYVLSQPGFFTKSGERVPQLVFLPCWNFCSLWAEAQHHLREHFH